MFLSLITCLWIQLSWALIAPITDPQGEVTLEQLKNEIQTLTSKVDKLTQKQDTVASFKAYVFHDISFSTGNIITFEHIEHNIGNSYNPSSGAFDAHVADAVVSFKANLSQKRKINVDSIVVFDDVENNIGNGYNPTSGVFHAPVAGIYIVTSQLEEEGDGASDYAIINQAVVETVQSYVTTYGTVTLVAVFHIGKGDDVYVKKVWDSGNASLREGHYSHFSGHLLRSD